jgi:peptidoglycan/xylan/chitin deacetylase (PgdA/CDA1 family)
MSEMPHDRDEAPLASMPWGRERRARPRWVPRDALHDSLAMPEIDRRKHDRRHRAGDAPLFAECWPAPRHRSIAQTVGSKASRFIARNLRTKSLSMRNSTPLVTFTFDDVPASGAELGAAILEREGVRATFYVAGAGCGAMSPNGRLATVHELRALVARGHEIGCHTFTHPAVSAIGNDVLAHEISRNGAFLKANIGIAPANFAFPYGDISFRTKRYLESRFDSCRCTLRGLNATTLDLGAMKSYELDNASINRAQIMNVIREAVKSNGWLIFVGHAVECNPARFIATPDLLAFAVAAAKREGCRPVTIAAGLELTGWRTRERMAQSVVQNGGVGDPS